MIKRSKPTRLLPAHYRHARTVEELLSNPDTPDEIRAQLELAILESAAEHGVSLVSPALARAVFLEIFRSTAEQARQGIPDSTSHHYGKPTIRLLTLLQCFNYSRSSLRSIKRPEDHCHECYDMLADFIRRAENNLPRTGN